MNFSFRLWLEYELSELNRRIEEDIKSVSRDYHFPRPQLASIINWLIPKYKEGYRLDAKTLDDIKQVTNVMHNATAGEANFGYVYYKHTGQVLLRFAGPMLAMLKRIENIDPYFLEGLNENHGPLVVWLTKHPDDLNFYLRNREHWHDVVKEFWRRAYDHKDFAEKLEKPRFNPGKMKEEVKEMWDEIHKVKVMSVDDAMFKTLMRIPGLQERGTADYSMLLRFQYEPVPGEGIYFKNKNPKSDEIHDEYLMARVLAGPKREGDKWRVNLNFRLGEHHNEQERKGYSDGYNNKRFKNPDANVPFFYKRAYNLGKKDMENARHYGHSFEVFKNLPHDVDCGIIGLNFGHHRRNLKQSIEVTGSKISKKYEKRFGRGRRMYIPSNVANRALCNVFKQHKWQSDDELSKFLKKEIKEEAKREYLNSRIGKVNDNLIIVIFPGGVDIGGLEKLYREILQIEQLKNFFGKPAVVDALDEYDIKSRINAHRHIDFNKTTRGWGLKTDPTTVINRLLDLLESQVEGKDVDIPSWGNIIGTTR